MGLEHAVSDMIWEGSPVAVRNSSFPEVRGRTKPVFWVSTVNGIDLVENPAHQQDLDQVDARSATAMSGGE